jgi:hypothetical protein
VDTAHVEALAMGLLAAFFLTLSGLALRLRLKTGVRNPWLWAGLFGGVFCLTLMVLNLNGVAFSGAGGPAHRSLPVRPIRTAV